MALDIKEEKAFWMIERVVEVVTMVVNPVVA
jgi:hypothetical protein